MSRGPAAVVTGLAWLLVCQLVGTALVAALDAPVPGPVVGMVLLLVVLRVRRPRDDHPVLTTSTGLLAHLQLLFVPAGVGILAYVGTVRADVLPLGAGLVVSWGAGLAAVGWTMQALVRRRATGRGAAR
ncbi:MAG: CidA/LrgA family protein [Nocardioides sp.]|nr:CidA/LrgA family protein [Nocardioides sp.]